LTKANKNDLIASDLGVFAYGRQIFSLSRAGYFQHFLSLTHGKHRTPNIALIAGGLLGLAVMLVVWFNMGGEAAQPFIGGVLLNMAVYGARIGSFEVPRAKAPWTILVAPAAAPIMPKAVRSSGNGAEGGGGLEMLDLYEAV
jgi:hypothetical protein